MKQPDCGCIMNINCRLHALHAAAPELLKAADDFLVALRTRGREGSVHEIVKLVCIVGEIKEKLD